MPQLRGMGRVFQPSYTYTEPETQTKELRTSTVWWIEFPHGGKPQRESSKSRKKADAEKLLKRRLGESGIGSLLPSNVASTTFEDLKNLITSDYEKNERASAGQLKIVLARLSESFAGMKASDITSARISAHQVHQKREGYSNGTINRDMSALKRMFRLAKRDGAVQNVPHIDMLDEKNVRKGFFEPSELDKLLKPMPKSLKPVFRVAYITGWRTKSELLTRQWKHVDFVNRRLRIEPGEDKNGSGRDFPFTSELETILKSQKKEAERIGKAGDETVDSVFFWPNGSPIKSYREGWKTAVEESGVERIPHDFRRTAVRNLEIAGVPRSAAMAMVGHKTQSIYSRYAIVDNSMLTDAARKLDVLHTAQRHSKRGKKRAPRSV